MRASYTADAGKGLRLSEMCMTDEYEPEITIHTTAADKATGEKSIVAGKSVTIVDTVTLDGLKKGTNDCLS